MPGNPWERLRRRRKDGEPGEDTITIAEGANAWWAQREVLETGRAPTRRNKKRESPDDGNTSKDSAFEQYFSTESLFEPPDPNAESSSVFDQQDPYVVLGVPATATWEEITAAHRRLAKLHHPDRQTDRTPEERESSERRIRELNIAYMELRRRKGK